MDERAKPPRQSQGSQTRDGDGEPRERPWPWYELTTADAASRAKFAGDFFDAATTLAKFDTDSFTNAVLLKVVKDGAFQADAATRALFADKFVTLAKLADGTACSVIGRSANSAGVYADIAAGTNGHVDKLPLSALAQYEAELFGHAKGAFTGAINARVGRFELAAKAGMTFRFEAVDLGDDVHPNTARMTLSNDQRRVQVTGSSVGGGMVKIDEVDGYRVQFGCEYDTMLVVAEDRPGTVNSVTGWMLRQGINIAFLRIERDRRGGQGAAVFRRISDRRQRRHDVYRQRSHLAGRKGLRED